MKHIFLFILLFIYSFSIAQNRSIHQFPRITFVDSMMLIPAGNRTNGVMSAIDKYKFLDSNDYKRIRRNIAPFDYNELINKPNIPSGTGLDDGNYVDVSVFGSGSTILINDQRITNNKLSLMPPNTIKANLSNSTTIATDANKSAIINWLNYHAVATSGSYIDLNNKPTIPLQFNPIAGTYIGLSGAYPNITISNTMPVLNLIAGTNVTISGTYPNLTVNSTSTNVGDNSMTALANDPTTGELDNQEFGLFKHTGTSQINLFVNDGGVIKKAGGSNTLDQTLALGNTTDTGIVFQDTTLVGNTSYPFLVVKPLTSEPLQSDLQFIRSKTGQSGTADNEVFAFGFNVIPVSGEPSLIESWESFYSPGAELTSRIVEKHEMFNAYSTAGGWNAGEWIRLSSYTINGTTNSIDLYHTTDAYAIRNKLGDYFSVSSNATTGATQLGIYSSDSTAGIAISTNGADNIVYVAPTINSSNSTIEFSAWEDVYFNLPQVRFQNTITATDVYSTAGTYLNIGQSHVNLVRGGVTNTMRLNFAYNSTNSANYFYIDGDGGSGEWKFYAQGGGFFPTFYSNGSEAMRLSTNRNMLIGTTSDDNSALVNISSTTKGFLPPRMTKTQRDAISSPATGLVIYQTDNTPGLRCYNGTNWMRYTETAD